MLLTPAGMRPAYAFPAPVQLFYVTLPEADGLTVLDAINTAANAPMYTYFSIAIGVDGSYVYYDQWEDGYTGDLANPTNAEILQRHNQPGRCAGLGQRPGRRWLRAQYRRCGFRVHGCCRRAQRRRCHHSLQRGPSTQGCGAAILRARYL